MTSRADDLQRAWSLRMSDPALAAALAAPWAGEADAEVLRAYAAWTSGDSPGALETLDRAEPALSGAGDRQWLARLYGLRGDLLLGLGQAHGALECFQEQLALGQEAGDLEMQGLAHNDTGVIFMWNDAQRARQRFQLAYDLFSVAPEDQANRGLAAFNLSVAYWELGEREQSDRFLEEAQGHVLAARAWPYWAGVVSQRAQRLGAAGDIAQARRLFREADALEMNAESRESLRFFEAKAETLYGDAGLALSVLETLRPWTARRQDMIDDYLDVLAQAQRRLNDPEAAYDTMRELLAAVQARHAREQATQLQRLEAQHRAEEAQRAVSHLSRLHREARRLNLHDELTGLNNRRGVEEWRRARPPGEAFTLAFMDIDHFKQINDSSGHRQGDEVIRAVAALLRGLAQPGDLCARLGGDEFVFARWTADVGEVAALMRRLDGQCRAATWPADLRVTLSIGVAGGSGPTEQQLDAADHQMYRAKQAGGGQVCVAAPEPSPPH